MQSVATRKLFTTLFLVTGLGCLLTPTDSTCAQEWMFRKSYYSHQSNPQGNPSLETFVPQIQHRTAYRPAYVGTHPGFAIRGGYRFNHIHLQSGFSHDHTVIIEDWLDVLP